MRLMEILKEAQAIIENESGEVLSEASKASIKKKYSKDRSKAFKLINGKKVTKQSAKRAVKNLKDDKAIEARNKIISAFMKSDIAEFRKILKTNLAKEAIDYLELLKAAHGGEKKLLATAGNKKTFLKKALGDINGLSDFATSEEEA